MLKEHWLGGGNDDSRTDNRERSGNDKGKNKTEVSFNVEQEVTKRHRSGNVDGEGKQQNEHNKRNKYYNDHDRILKMFEFFILSTISE